MKNVEINKLLNEDTKNRKQCPHCGAKMLLGNLEKRICYKCGNYIFKNKEEEFKYRLKEKLNHERKN